MLYITPGIEPDWEKIVSILNHVVSDWSHGHTVCDRSCFWNQRCSETKV